MLVRLLRIAGAIVLVLIPVYVTYLLGRRLPDVKYTLSEGIPVSFVSSPGSLQETIQQLEVKNVGNAVAQELVIKIDKQISSHDISKHSAADQVNVFDNQQPFEIDYAELPPGASFQVVLRSAGSGIDQGDLSVSHIDGVAREALSADEPSALDMLAPWILGSILLAYAWTIGSMIRGSSLDSYKIRKRRVSIAELRRLNAPWFVLPFEWPSIHLEIFADKLAHDYSYDRGIQNNTHYGFLTIDKPDHLDSDKWVELVAKAIRVISSEIASTLRYPSHEGLVALLRLSRPKHFPEPEWANLRKNMLDEYKTVRTRYVSDIDSLLRALREERPVEIPENVWNDAASVLQSRLTDVLASGILLSPAPLGYLNKHDLGALTKDQRDRLNRLASEIQAVSTLRKLVEEAIQGIPLPTSSPPELADYQWLQMQTLQGRLSRILGQAERFEVLQKLLAGIQEQTALPKVKPDSMSETDWRWLTGTDSELSECRKLRTREREIAKAELQLSADQAAVHSLRTKVEKQLRMIHEVLTDPKSFSRIEVYDETFAPGNLDNLRKLAHILESAEQLPGVDSPNSPSNPTTHSS